MTPDIEAIRTRAHDANYDAMQSHVDALALLTHIDTLTAELKKRAKQIGVACLTHDLTHALECGRCFHDARDRIAKLEGALKKLVQVYESEHDDATPYRPDWLRAALEDGK